MRAIWTAFFLLSLSLTAAAQSGRRIQPTPTPAPSEDTAADYSESTPKPKRPVWIPPAQRNEQLKAQPKPIIDTTPDGTDGELKIETSLIKIPVSVFDRYGLYIPNLRQSDFKVFEDGKEQEIAFFGTADNPFTVVLLLDTSPSTEYKIDEIRQAAKAFVNQLKPQDSVMVVEFDGNVHPLSQVTKDRQQIYRAIDKADFGYGTALYDAVFLSLKRYLASVEGRKAIVLFTDGVDTQSGKASYDSTLAVAEESDVLIFPIYYNTFFDNQRGGSIYDPTYGGLPAGTRPEDYAVGKKYLEEIADYTGGRVFRPEATPGGLQAAFEGIAEELRRQYQIGYIPADDGKPGQRKQIKVRVNRPNLVIRARDSYIVGAETEKKPTASPAK